MIFEQPFGLRIRLREFNGQILRWGGEADGGWAVNSIRLCSGPSPPDPAM